MYGQKWDGQGGPAATARQPGMNFQPMGYQYQPSGVGRPPFPTYETMTAPDPFPSMYPGMFGVSAPFPSPSPVTNQAMGSGQLPSSNRKAAVDPLQMSPQQEQTMGTEKFKTELCRKFALTGFCRYGDMCQFAHGANELRALVRHPLYKTSPCKSFEATGTCRYGARCRFIHNEGQQELATLARGVPALNLQLTEPTWEEAQAAAIDAVQHMALATGLSPQVGPQVAPPTSSVLRQSPQRASQRGPIPEPASLEKPMMTTSPLNPISEQKPQMQVAKERTLTMSGRSKTEPSELSRTLSSPMAQANSGGEVRSISSLIMINTGTSGHSPVHGQSRAPGGSSSSERPPHRVGSSVNFAVDEDMFPPANLDTRRLPVANSASWVNLADMASPSNGKQGDTRFGGHQSDSIKHSYSQPLMAGGDTWLSFSDAKPKAGSSLASLPVLPPASPVNNNVGGGNGFGRSSSVSNFANSTSSPNLLNAFAPATETTQQQANFRRAASYANHIWFESTADGEVESTATNGGWTRARSVEGRLNIFRNLSDQDLAKTAAQGARAPRLTSFEEKLGEVGLALSEDEDRATDEDRAQDDTEDEGFSVGKF